MVEVGDEEEDDEILQSLDRYFDDHEKTVTSEEKMTLRQMLERGRLELFRAEVPEPEKMPGIYCSHVLAIRIFHTAGTIIFSIRRMRWMRWFRIDFLKR